MKQETALNFLALAIALALAFGAVAILYVSGYMLPRTMILLGPLVGVVLHQAILAALIRGVGSKEEKP